MWTRGGEKGGKGGPTVDGKGSVKEKRGESIWCVYSGVLECGGGQLGLLGCEGLRSVETRVQGGGVSAPSVS